jgi:hypothetical protein
VKFRAWLISRLADTGYALRVCTDEERVVLAAQLGVEPAVLLAAHQERQRRRAEAARTLVRKGSGGTDSDHPQVEVNMPSDVWEAWHDACDQAAITSSTMLRSIVHAYLQGDWEPEHLSRHWVLRGKVYEVAERRYHRETGKKWPYRERALITKGANLALARRAERKGVSKHAVLRGLILEVVAGRLASVRPIDATNMWNDAARYLRRPETGGDEP